MSESLPTILAIAIDWLLGEPPNVLHPVAWFGRFVQAMERRVPRDNPRRELLFGAGIAVGGIALAVLPVLALERFLQRIGQPRGTCPEQMQGSRGAGGQGRRSARV